MFAKQDLAAFDSELHFRVGADTEAVADVFGNGDLTALSYFHTYKYDSVNVAGGSSTLHKQASPASGRGLARIHSDSGGLR